MIVVACLSCALGLRILPESAASSGSVRELQQLVGTGSDYWPDKYPCPACGKMVRGMAEASADMRVFDAGMTLHEVTPQQAFAAFNGLGLPDERSCNLEEVQKVITEQPVRRVHGSNIRGSDRTLIDSIELWDGTKLHFGAGGDGAVIYRITRPVNYTKKQLGPA